MRPGRVRPENYWRRRFNEARIRRSVVARASMRPGRVRPENRPCANPLSKSILPHELRAVSPVTMPEPESASPT